MNRVSLWQRAGLACQRRAARWFGRRPFALPPGPAIVSFTFDDFPRSALIDGGAILERFGLGATYYASLGLAGRTTPCGDMFELEDIPPLLELGHELGCHTFDHCPAWTTAPAAFAASVERNAQVLRELFPAARLPTLSYPISHPRPGTKERVCERFACCRGGGQTFNAGTIDLNYLSAFFLEQSLDEPDAVARTILEARRAGGWLIFATHDISDRPSPFGCTRAFFRQVVQFTVDSGTQVLPVARAWDVLRARAAQRSDALRPLAGA